MSVQQSLLSDRHINIDELNEIMNRVIFPDAVHVLKKKVAQIPSGDSKFSYANDLKERFEKIEEEARNGKDFITPIKAGEGEDKTIGCSESGYFRFTNPIDSKPDSIQAILYKKPVKLDVDGFEERRFCSQFNSNVHETSDVSHKEFSFPALLVKELAGAIGGIVRDHSLTDTYSPIKADERLDRYNDEKQLKSKSNSLEM